MSELLVYCISCNKEVKEKESIFDNIYGNICYNCINSKFIISEYCINTECNYNKLEPILDEEGYVIKYFCDKCCTNWNLEDLKKPLKEKYQLQKSMF
ncbi:MAG: hypothetical protein ACFFG0_18120 [Candidatus Thorarchaeota archaeon]